MLAANAALFTAGLFTIAIVVNCLANRDGWRVSIDSTKTRAYSLSPQTKQLLADLDGDWKIAMVMVESESDPAAIRQIDEVLQRYAEASDRIEVVRIDPTRTESLGQYDSLLAELRSRYRLQIDAYDRALDEGEAAFDELRLFAEQQAGALQEAAGQLANDDADRRTIMLRAQLMAILAQEGQKVLDQVAAARRADQSRPLPDYETARSILASALSQWSSELYDTAQLFKRWRRQPDTQPALRQIAAASAGAFEDMALRLAETADPLQQLEPLELSGIGRQLQSGEVALVIGPPGAAAIPWSQLVPIGATAESDGVVMFDRRFRGEQHISATIRSLIMPSMPLVVFVHAEEDSLLKPHAQQVDLVGVGNILAASRYDLEEWIVGQADKPVPDQGQPAVWIVVPPPAGGGLPKQQQLANAAASLISEGQPVLLSVYPSPLSRYGQTDPWAGLGASFGLVADTSHVIIESIPLAEGGSQKVTLQTVDRFGQSHPIAGALNGRQTCFPFPVPIRPAGKSPAVVEQQEIAAITPLANRHLELVRAATLQTDLDSATGQPIDERVPLLFAAQRPHPAAPGASQRFLMIGSGGWMISNVADAVLDVGGGRIALVNPGNHELMLSAVAWLAGLDELIAPSPTSQEVARLDEITESVRTRWAWIALVAMPGGCLLLGLVVWRIRR